MRISIRIILIAAILSSTTLIFSQSFENIEMFWNNSSFYNPAYSGLINRYHGTTSCNYNQPLDIYSILNSFDCKVDKLHGGIGINYYRHSNITNSIDAYKLSYSYHYAIGNKGNIGFGISPVLYHSFIDMRNLVTFVDTVINNINQNDFAIDFGIGYKRERIEVGLSITEFIPSSYLYTQNVSRLIFSYEFDIHRISINPRILLESSLDYIKDIHYSIDMPITFKDRFWLGCGCTNKSFQDTRVSLSIGYDIVGKYRLGYNYSFESKLKNQISEELLFSVMID
jgi:type IX secretion system PorP/SprF family membrane protein